VRPPALEAVESLDPWSEAIIKAVDAVAPFVVSVTSVDAKETRATVNTGLVLDGRHVMTHAPVYTPGDHISVAFASGERLEADMVTADPLYFLAILGLRGTVNLGSLPLAETEDVRTGVIVLALGNAFRPECGASLGVVSATDVTIYRPERFPVDGLILTDAAVHPAAHVGGPLVTLDGRLVGVNWMPWTNGLSMAVAAPVVMRLAHQMLEYGRATHPWLGFTGDTEVCSSTMVSLLQLPAQRGLAVKSVVQDGPGARAGVQVFDLIVAVSGQPVQSLGAIRQVLSVHRPGEAVALTILRGGELVQVEMPVEEMPRLASTPWG